MSAIGGTIERMTDTEQPYRVVDSHNQGWHREGGPEGLYRGFDPTSTTKLLEHRPYDDIVREFGPVRPVLEPLDEDREQLRAALAAAGRKAIGSLASALEQVHHEIRERASEPGDTYRQSGYRFAVRAMTAGRPGSWESELLPHVWIFGNGLNLWPYKPNDHNPDEMRATGPNPKRVHVEARDQMAAVLRRWVDSPDRYTEVAEHLAAIVSSYADEAHGPDGWAKIADQWLQPGGLAKDDIHACYGLLYSVSEHFSPDSIYA
ncbi:hypothetical protein NWFMUON74_72380 (plasmid) [Nocardia wallacei]|uniref:Uncharacterized protein n=2 Tax=Nocardia wallacei TaxID=480035 RepID=A0A7G1KXW8_9NOCA|nr:hypothetical protein NWFMUON74_72380 [Nocardia wallacei]